MPLLQQGIYPTKKAVADPLFSTIGSHFTAMNFLATTDILEQFKDGRKSEEIEFNRTVRQSLAKGEGKNRVPHQCSF